MSEPSNQKSVDLEEESSKLDEGLRSCRAVLSGYRTLLGGSTDSNEVGSGNSSEPESRTDLPNDC